MHQRPVHQGESRASAACRPHAATPWDENRARNEPPCGLQPGMHPLTPTLVTAVGRRRRCSNIQEKHEVCEALDSTRPAASVCCVACSPSLVCCAQHLVFLRGSGWLPSTRLDSIMTPRMLPLPSPTCAPTSRATPTCATLPPSPTAVVRPPATGADPFDAAREHSKPQGT